MRILALCGYKQNASIFRKWTTSLREDCEDVEFVFVEPPNVFLNPTHGQGAPEINTPEELTARYWFEHDIVDPTKYVGLENSFLVLQNILDGDEKGFQGIFGFSQGATMAFLLCAMLERPHLHPAFSGRHPIMPFDFAIMCGGFLPTPRVPDLRDWYAVGTPTLHIIGKLDCIIKTEHSLMLADKCSDARIEYHPGGHFVPVQPRWRTFFRDYIFSFREGGSMGDLPPLTPSPSSTPSTSPVLNKSPKFASRPRKEARTVTSLQQPACT